MGSLRDALARPGGFVVAAELVTSRGPITSEYGEEETMLDGPVGVKDNALQGTSAWGNTFLGRDHQAADGSEPRSP